MREAWIARLSPVHLAAVADLHNPNDPLGTSTLWTIRWSPCRTRYRAPPDSFSYPIGCGMAPRLWMRCARRARSFQVSGAAFPATFRSSRRTCRSNAGTANAKILDFAVRLYCLRGQISELTGGEQETPPQCLSAITSCPSST